jgi:transcriptional regulator
VIAMLASGMLNKQIASELGTAESTVKVQRSRAMEKMQAQSLVDLAKMIEKLKEPSEKASVSESLPASSFLGRGSTNTQ